MGLLISIDNGGTLTDVCATDGTDILHVKTITTPHDLTECFVKGLESLSERMFGEADLPRLVGEVDYIRYSTTQGTNAIVQRKGPRIGLLTDCVTLIEATRTAQPNLFEAFVADRSKVVTVDVDDEAGRLALVGAVADLVSIGANRVVVALSGSEATAREAKLRRILYKAFPRHLLGAVPLLFSTELSQIGSEERRVWAALINGFLHPAMESFLYNAENRLRDHRCRKPLLIFGNDGTSTRVAKTVAIKTYSSGPQGGVVGAEVLLRHYGIAKAVSMDIGGTTTDIAVFDDAMVQVDAFGDIEGAPVPIPLARILSIGVGGGSIIRAANGAIAVGPESVGSAPGPACFGRGGTQATITDALVCDGILDPLSYFGGRLKLDANRAERAVQSNVGDPLGLTVADAVPAMMDAYDAKIARALEAENATGPGRVLMAFGGAGPMSACGVAEKAGYEQVLIPRFAAVFSAFGISFSDICHTYVTRMEDSTDAALADATETLSEQGRRGMLAEGFDLEKCDLDWSVLVKNGSGYERSPLAVLDERPNTECWLELKATRPIAKTTLGGSAVEQRSRAKPHGTRTGRRDLPLYRLEDLVPGDWGVGPCLVEEAFFTAQVKDGWNFTISDNGDIFLRR